jgi:hypothetical protein
MHHSFLRISYAFSVLLFAFPAAAQTNVITVRFIGNCGLYMTDGSLDVYVDFPYRSGAYNYMEYPASEIDSIRRQRDAHLHPSPSRPLQQEAGEEASAAPCTARGR